MAIIDLYCTSGCPACRLVHITAGAIGVPLNVIKVDVDGGENLKPEYLKMNPQHTVPTMKDGNFILCESRAIITYLMNKYADGHPLYPKDPEKRALVDHRLQFDIGTLYQSFATYYYPQMLEKAAPVAEYYKQMQEAYAIFEQMLEGRRYATGDEMTIADFALMCTVSANVDGGGRFNLEKYPNVQRWYEDCKKNVPGYEASLPMLEGLKVYFDGVAPPPE